MVDVIGNVVEWAEAAAEEWTQQVPSQQVGIMGDTRISFTIVMNISPVSDCNHYHGLFETAFILQTANNMDMRQ